MVAPLLANTDFSFANGNFIHKHGSAVKNGRGKTSYELSYKSIRTSIVATAEERIKTTL